MCNVCAVCTFSEDKIIAFSFVKFHDIPSKNLSYNGHIAQVVFQGFNKLPYLSK